ncbi:MAG: ethylbenzene dehydrogenase-related protein, partial [candidate division Zixibacteria bacterium]|nr:ethylbenzene dehydrogenase-related protein [candidate division Zixibacteria bacterium]
VMGDEDRVMLMFEITHLTWFEHDGCLVTCHAGSESANLPGTNYHSTKSAQAKMDIWSWSSITSNPTGYSDDKYMDGTGQILDEFNPLGYVDGIKGDIGRATSMANLLSVHTATVISAYRPLYQTTTDPDSIATYPLWDWQITTYTAKDWSQGFAVPTFITTVPTLSRADIMSRGKFDNGTWTVEFRRLRATGNGDDTKF